MQMNDMVLISVDDHTYEPLTDRNDNNYWTYQRHDQPLIGLNAVVGRLFEEFGMEPNSFGQLRPGCYDVHARIDDMDVNGIAASMCFGDSIGFDGQTFHKAPNKTLALRHMAEARVSGRE